MQAGGATPVTVAFTMHEGMGGPHHFVIVLRTNDPSQPEKRLSVKANFVPPK